MSSILYYTLQFILGGAAVAGIIFIAKYVNPKYTGIIYALPAILIVSIIFIYLDQGISVSRNALRSILVYEFTLIFFILLFYLLINKINFWLAIGAALISWLFIAIIIQLKLR